MPCTVTIEIAGIKFEQKHFPICNHSLTKSRIYKFDLIKLTEPTLFTYYLYFICYIQTASQTACANLNKSDLDAQYGATASTKFVKRSGRHMENK